VGRGFGGWVIKFWVENETALPKLGAYLDYFFTFLIPIASVSSSTAPPFPQIRMTNKE
jgi:hypothetical protein